MKFDNFLPKYKVNEVQCGAKKKFQVGHLSHTGELIVTGPLYARKSAASVMCHNLNWAYQEGFMHAYHLSLRQSAARC